METLQKQTLYVCGCCKHTLPSEAFYVDKKTGLSNNYCKECRKSASRKYTINICRLFHINKQIIRKWRSTCIVVVI